jgi:hypothetical protein
MPLKWAGIKALQILLSCPALALVAGPCRHHPFVGFPNLSSFIAAFGLHII